MSETVKQNVAGVGELRYVIVKHDENRAIAAFKNRGDAETLLERRAGGGTLGRS